MVRPGPGVVLACQLETESGPQSAPEDHSLRRTPFSLLQCIRDQSGKERNFSAAQQRKINWLERELSQIFSIFSLPPLIPWQAKKVRIASLAAGDSPAQALRPATPSEFREALRPFLCDDLLPLVIAYAATIQSSLVRA